MEHADFKHRVDKCGLGGEKREEWKKGRAEDGFDLTWRAIEIVCDTETLLCHTCLLCHVIAIVARKE